MRPTEKNSSKGNKGPAVVCDFDDTTVLENVAEMLLKEFGGEGWQEYQRQNVQHRMSLKEYQERAFQTVKVGREAMKDHVKENATLRPHFKALYEYCRRTTSPSPLRRWGWTSTWRLCWNGRDGVGGVLRRGHGVHG